MVYSVDYLERLRIAVEEFERSFEAWSQTQDEYTMSETRGLFPTVATREGVDPDLERRLELDLAEKAGAASRAVAVAGSYIEVSGLGRIDAISNWAMMSHPRSVITTQDVRRLAASARGRLKSMIEDAQVRGDGELPAFAPSKMHPSVWSAAVDHWTTHQYRVAVREASEALTAEWQEKLGRRDVSGTTFWQQTLSPGPPEDGRPKLRWPGADDDRTAKSMRAGLERLAKSLAGLGEGLNLTVRNLATHSQNELSEQEAMERLAAYSFLARILDQRDIVRSEADGTQ